MEPKPEELLVEAWVPTYKARMQVVHNQLAQIRSTLYALERVATFPFDLFGEYPGPFWRLVQRSMETAVVVGLWRLLFDTDDNSLTLRKLRNQVMTYARDDPARKYFAEKLRSREVDSRIRQIEGKVRDLRDKHFAHLDSDTATDVPAVARGPQITFTQLRDLASAAHDLMNAIAINTFYMTVDPDYDPTITQGGQPIKPDVECLFDDMVARSEDLRMPETKPYEFTFYWKHRTPAQRVAFNQYRRKFGMPEVPTDG